MFAILYGLQLIESHQELPIAERHDHIAGAVDSNNDPMHRRASSSDLVLDLRYKKWRRNAASTREEHRLIHAVRYCAIKQRMANANKLG